MSKCFVVLLVSALALMLLAFNPGTIKAHSASDLVLSYDFPNQTLNITVTHFVGDPNTHYIAETTILKNSVLFDTIVNTSQPTTDTFVYGHPVPAADGDILQVTVTCNAFGSLTDQITVVGPPPSDTEDPTIDIETPTANITYNTDSTPITIGGTASDNFFVASVYWDNSASGGSGTATGTTSWTASVPLVLGENNITVSAIDFSTGLGTDNFTVIYTPTVADTTDPMISITTPTTGQTHETSSTPISIGGTASDNVNVVNITWENAATGESGTAAGTDSWSVSVPLAEGSNPITLTASDSFGNTASASITVDYEPSVPGPGEDTENLWVFHATLMTIGFALLVLAIVISTGLRKMKWWLKVHKSLGILGSTFAVLGLISGLYMVSVWGSPHFRVPHALLGITTIILAMVQPVLGFMQPRSKKIRPVHRWLGRIVVILMFFSIIAGMSQAGVI
jgi:hypothetical protein